VGVADLNGLDGLNANKLSQDCCTSQRSKIELTVYMSLRRGILVGSMIVQEPLQQAVS
jgi:hypothetical protein